MVNKNVTSPENQSQEVCKSCNGSCINLTKTDNIIEFTACDCAITSDVVTSLLVDLRETQGIQENFAKLGTKLLSSRRDIDGKKVHIMPSIISKYYKLLNSNAEKTLQEAEEIKNNTKDSIVITELTDENCRCKKSAVTYRVFKIVKNVEKKSYRVEIVRCNCEHVKQNGFVPEIAAYQEFLRNEWTSFEISEHEYSILTRESKIEIVNNFSDNLFNQWNTNDKVAKIRNVNKIQLISKSQSFLAIALDKIDELEKAYEFRTIFKSTQAEQKVGEPIANECNVIPFASKTVKLFEGKGYDCPLVWFLIKHPIFPIISDEKKGIIKRQLTKTIGGLPTEQKIETRFTEYGKTDHDFIMTSMLVSEAEERFLYYILHLWYKITAFKTKEFETTFNEIHKIITGSIKIGNKDKERYREYLTRLGSIQIYDVQGKKYFGIINIDMPNIYNDKCQQIIRISIDHMIFRSIECKQFTAIYLNLLKHFGSYAGKIIGFALCNDMKKMMDMSLNRWKIIFGVSDDIKEHNFVKGFQDGLKKIKVYGALESFEIYKSKNTGEKTLKLRFVDGFEQKLLETTKKLDVNTQENAVSVSKKSKACKI